MSQELEDQQRIVVELRERLQSLETERHSITEKIKVAEAKIEAQELHEKVKIKSEVVDQLRVKLRDLEEKLRSEEPTIIQEQPHAVQQQEEQSREEQLRERTFF